jgi:hypothetical protein
MQRTNNRHPSKKELLRSVILALFLLLLSVTLLPAALAQEQVSATVNPNHVSFVIDGDAYEIRYKASGATILDAKADLGSRTITVTINSTDDGKLSLNLIDALIQARKEPTGQDTPFLVKVDGMEVPYEEIQNDSGRRAIEIPFTKGQSKIEITGTWIVPEFPASLAVILASSLGISVLAIHRKLKI